MILNIGGRGQLDFFELLRRRKNLFWDCRVVNGACTQPEGHFRLNVYAHKFFHSGTETGIRWQLEVAHLNRLTRLVLIRLDHGRADRRVDVLHRLVRLRFLRLRQNV